MPVVRVHEQRSLRHHRNGFDRGACKERESARIVRIVRSALDINPFAVEVSRMIDENNFGSAHSIPVAIESDKLPARTDVYGYVIADLLEILRNLTDRAIQRNDDKYPDSLSRLNIRESLNSLCQPAGAGIGCILRGDVYDCDRIA